MELIEEIEELKKYKEDNDLTIAELANQFKFKEFDEFKKEFIELAFGFSKLDLKLKLKYIKKR